MQAPEGPEPARQGPLRIRRLLSGLYRLSGALAGIFLVAICAIVVAQVVGNAIDRAAIWLTGRAIGIIIPAYSDFAGFFLAASTFFALAYTLMTGGHVRVRLVLGRLPAGARRLLEVLCAALAAVIAATATYFSAMLMLQSWRFGDVVTGMVAMPLWVPQMALVLGLAILTLALLDILFSVLLSEELPDCL